MPGEGSFGETAIGEGLGAPVGGAVAVVGSLSVTEDPDIFMAVGSVPFVSFPATGRPLKVVVVELELGQFI